MLADQDSNLSLSNHRDQMDQVSTLDIGRPGQQPLTLKSQGPRTRRGDSPREDWELPAEWRLHKENWWTSPTASLCFSLQSLVKFFFVCLFVWKISNLILMERRGKTFTHHGKTWWSCSKLPLCGRLDCRGSGLCISVTVMECLASLGQQNVK